MRTVRDGGATYDLPPSLRDVLLARAEQLSRPAQRLLRTAAVAGRRVPERLLAEVAEVSAGELYEALREAVDASLLLVDGTDRGYAFRHALTRDAVYADLLPGERVGAAHRLRGGARPRPRAGGGRRLGRGHARRALVRRARHAPRTGRVRPGRPPGDGGVRSRRGASAPGAGARGLAAGRGRAGAAPGWTGWASAGKLAADAAYRSGDPRTGHGPLLADALAELSADTSGARTELPLVLLRHALLLERYAVVSGTQGESRCRDGDTPQRALGLLPPTRSTRAHAVVLATMASSQMRADDMTSCAETARRAIEAARAAGAKDAEADASVSLGSALSYLGPAEASAWPAARRAAPPRLNSGGDPYAAGPAPPRRCPRCPRSSCPAPSPTKAGFAVAERTTIALRAYINLSDVLELLGGTPRRPGPRPTGIRAGDQDRDDQDARLVPHREPCRLAAADGPARRGRRAGRPGPRRASGGVFSATLHQFRAEIAVMRGRYDEAAVSNRVTRRIIGDTIDMQFTQTLRTPRQ